MNNKWVKIMKKYIKKHNASQDIIAHILGTNKTTVSRWMNNKHVPSKAWRFIIETKLNNC